jgi:hypothetical protein
VFTYEQEETNGLKEKFLSFFLDRNDELIRALRTNYPDIFMPEMTDDDVILFYYKLTLEGVTNMNMIDENRPINVVFKPSPLQISIHTCSDQIDIAYNWFASADINSWVLASTTAFMDRQYTNK